jgi:demethylmenaquinone methyltransferase/2-methoxy-6-polyprenyl-1,4-benzoquinol methylase
MSKQKKIISMFNDIADKYDISNSFISLGIESIWRAKSCKIALNYAVNRDNLFIGDVACGTGAMIGEWSKVVSKYRSVDYSIKGIDPSSKMLKIAKEKYPNNEFFLSTADKLPFDDNSVDILSISYGMRNIVNKEDSFDEMYRVLKDDGILVVIEFFDDKNTSFISSIKNFYIKYIMPIIGGIITKHKKSYEYLSSSIEEIGDIKSFQDRLRNRGLEAVYVRGFTFDIAYCMIVKKVASFNINKTNKKKNIKSKVKENTDDVDLPFFRALKTVSMRCFIKYYDDFTNKDITTKKLITKMQKSETYTKDSCQSRISNARFILKNGYTQEALEYIIDANRVDDSTRRKARKILKNIKAN